jgi:hypothetical protein
MNAIFRNFLTTLTMKSGYCKWSLHLKCQVAMRSKQGTTHQSCDTPGQLWSHPTQFLLHQNDFYTGQPATSKSIASFLWMQKTQAWQGWMDFGATSTLGVFFNNNFVLLSVVLEALFWANFCECWKHKTKQRVNGLWSNFNSVCVCVCVFLVIILFCYLFWKHCFGQS